MKKRIAGFLALLLICGQIIGFASYERPEHYVKLSVNGVVINAHTAYGAPIVVDNRAMIPTRMFFESVGVNVQWFASDKTVVVEGLGYRIKMRIDDFEAEVNGVTKRLEVCPKLLPEPSSGQLQTMLPLRFVSETLGANVSWDGKTQMVSVTSKAFEAPIAALKEGINANSQWALIFANPWQPLPEDFSVKTKIVVGSYAVDERIYSALTAMLRDARAQGLSPEICSAYRSVSKQTTIFNNQISQYMAKGYTRSQAEAEAAKWVAIPGTSEHHTGLAVDIVASSYRQLNKAQENTAEQKWLMANAHKYGFILRYPENKVYVTGINYEPWHYRYVGKEIATFMFERDMCLEEFFGGRFRHADVISLK